MANSTHLSLQPEPVLRLWKPEAAPAYLQGYVKAQESCLIAWIAEIPPGLADLTILRFDPDLEGTGVICRWCNDYPHPRWGELGWTIRLEQFV